MLFLHHNHYFTKPSELYLSQIPSTLISLPLSIMSKEKQIFIPIILLSFDITYINSYIVELLQHLEDHQEQASIVMLAKKALLF